MKLIINSCTFKTAAMLLCLFGAISVGYGQDTKPDSVSQNKSDTVSQNVEEQVEQPVSSGKKPVKNTFEGIWILDNQTVMVPVKGTFEFDILHRFGTWEKGYQDFFGLFGGTNIRLGFNYVPIEKLLVGVSFTEYNLTWEAYAKYALLKQTQDGGIPVSITYHGNVAVDTKKEGDYPHSSNRYMFFNQLIIARKIDEKFSIQVAPSLTHVNSVQGYYPGDTTTDGKSVVGKEMLHDHFAIAFSGKWQLSSTMSLLVNVDQPITKHMTNNPSPNVSVGVDITTSAHSFQVLIGNYQYITPSRNNYYNNNDFTNNQWLIGFNITRLWNF